MGIGNGHLSLGSLGAAIIAATGIAVAAPPASSAEVVWEGNIRSERGEPVRIVKDRRDGKFVVTYYDSAGQSHTPEGFAAREASAQGKIDAGLEQTLGGLKTDESIPVIIYLASQPLGKLSDEIRATYRPQKAALAHRARGGDPSVARDADDLRTVMLHELGRRQRAAVGPDQDVLVNHLTSIGGVVVHRLILINAVSARLTPPQIAEVAQRPDVRRICDNEKMEGHLNVSIPAIGAGTWWTGGYTGGTFDVAVVDSGLDTAHPAFSGKTITSHIDLDQGQLDGNFNDNAASSDDLHGHGTCCTGIVMSNDATCRGVAYGDNITYNLKSGYRNWGGTTSMYWDDAIDNVDWAIMTVGDPAEAFNFSYGGTVSVDDTDMARFWDSVVDNTDGLVAISAGNSGPSQYTLHSPSIFYNGICVANMNDYDTTTRTDDLIYSSSSRGPTQNGRKKPDLAAPGTNIMSPMYNWEGVNPDFGNWTGTSMAAPHVAGAMTLLRQRLPEITSGEAPVIKAILINSATETGAPGWDSTYGWGYLNMTMAYNQFKYAVDPIHPAGSAGDKAFYAGSLAAGEKATLVWNRRVDYDSGGDYPVTWFAPVDLDMLLYDSDTGTLLTSSTSAIDNVEQVVAAGAANVVVKVQAISASFPARNPEYCALAASTDLTSSSEPVLSVSPAFSQNPVSPGGQFTVTALLENNGPLPAHNCNVTLNLPAGFSIVSGANPQNAGTVYGYTGKNNVVWTVQASSSNGDYDIGLDVTSNSYGETYTASGQGSLAIPVRMSQFVVE